MNFSYFLLIGHCVSCVSDDNQVHGASDSCKVLDHEAIWGVES